MFKKIFKIFAFTLPISLIMLSAYLFLEKYYSNIDNSVRDMFFNYRGTIEPKNKILVIDIDEKSLDRFGQYPWDRTILGKIIENLTNAGVSIIGLDVMFPENDRTSPHRFAEKLNIQGDFINNDLIFGEIVSKTPTILGYTFDMNSKDFIERETPMIPATFIEKGLTTDNDFMIKAKDIILNIPEIQENSYSSGFFNNTADNDGMIRQVPLVIKYNDEIFPSLALEIYRVVSNINKVIINYDLNGITGLSIGDKFIPTDRYGRILVNFRGGGKTFKYISAMDIYDMNFSADEVKNSITIVGTSASGLLDIRSISFDNAYPGVEVHANVVDNILSADFLSKPSWVDGYNVIIIILLVFIVSTLFSVIPANFVLLILPILIFVISAELYYKLFNSSIAVNMIFPYLAMTFTTIVAMIINLFFEQKQKKLIKNKFAAKVSPAVMEDLIKNANSDVMVGHEREITVMFSDMRNFTNISESLSSAKVLIEFLNEYMNPMTEIIVKSGGTVDKFIGDAIMAYWNAPLDVTNHPDKAVSAVIDQLHACVPLNIRIKQDPRFTATVKMAEKLGKEPVEIGMGLNTGIAVVGEMGSKGRSDYTAIGDPINLSARLESLCKYYDSKCNISNFTKSRIPETKYILRFLDLVTVKGKSEPIEIWQIIDYEGGQDGHYLFKVSREELQAELNRYNEAIHLYKSANFHEALNIFKELNDNKKKTNKEIYGIYIERCEHYIENPPLNFNGVFKHTTKG
jgi:adenylate cyclase